MKRLMVLFLVLIFGLSGCSAITQDNLLTVLKAAATNAENEQINKVTNISKNLYSYYLPPSIGRKTSTPTSTILSDENINILMNLDVIGIISDSYYKTTASTGSFKSMLASTDNLITFDSAMTNSAGTKLTYRVSILYVNSKMILLTLEGGYFIFTAITPISLSQEILYDMIKIARSCTVDSPAVLLAFSTRETIDYKKETLDMFSQIAPESGTILDMISGGKPVTNPSTNSPE